MCGVVFTCLVMSAAFIACELRDRPRRGLHLLVALGMLAIAAAWLAIMRFAAVAGD